MKTQQQTFQSLWSKFSDQIRNNNGAVDYPETLCPDLIGTIVRMPEEIAQICRKQWSSVLPDDYHYPAQDIHFTLLNMGPSLPQDMTGRQLEQLGDEIQRAVIGLPGLHLEVRGFNVFPTTIYAQVYDVNGVLELYRSTIAAAINRYTGSNHTTEALVKGIAHSNILRFKKKPAPFVADMVEPLRKTLVGRFEARQIELITTDKLMSGPHTTVHKLISISKQAARQPAPLLRSSQAIATQNKTPSFR